MKAKTLLLITLFFFAISSIFAQSVVQPKIMVIPYTP